MEARRPAAGMQLAKDLLGRLAHQCADMAMRLYPQSGSDGMPIWRSEEHRKEFFAWSKEFRDHAAQAAPYQSPTFRAIQVVPDERARGDDTKVIELTIFDSLGEVVAEKTVTTDE